MDEYMLNDLLECSVCLERLDTSSRVLPCQHTFCKKCLEEIVSTKKELRCPECRVLVNIKIEDLPPNVLLMRILGGMRSAQPKNRTVVPNRMPQANVLPAPAVTQPAAPVQHHATAPDITRVHFTPKQSLLPNQPCARAVYDYLSNEPGDLKFKKGDIILLRKKMDANWYHGESGGNHGVFPLTYVQVITPLPSHIPQCKALYDFRMTNDDEEGCLTFNKGEVITVIRRVDENWAEGKLVDRIGIFPLAFVELNNVARALMKLSSNSQPGPSRLAPPTPTSEDMTPLIPTDHSRTVATSQAPPHHAPVVSSHNATPHHHITMGAASDSSSAVSSSASSSTTTPNTSSSNTSSSSSTAPSSPTSPPPPRPAPCQSVISPPPRPAASLSSPPPRPAHNPNMSPPLAAQPQQGRGKRHSFSTGVLQSGHPHPNSHRHSAEMILAPSEMPSTDSSPAEHISLAQPGEPLQRHGSQRHRRSSSIDTASCVPPPPQGAAPNAQTPAAYVALYPYKPQKVDEMELKKGGVYMVTERCQDGWFKGTSNRTQKGGVFPGNYVVPAKTVSGSMQAQLRGLTRPSSSPSSSPQTSSPRSNGTSSLEPASTVSYTRIGTKQSVRQLVSSQPPELPPRASSPHMSSPPPHAPSAISSSWHAAAGHDVGSPAPLGRSQSAVMTPSPTAVIVPPNVTVTPRTSEKQVKERKEKSGVSLMRRLTNIKKSKSPPPMSSYSMDNPVFDDGSVTASPVHPVHVRSGSCPSQLLQVVPLDGSTAHHRRLFGTGSQRLKQKSDRPNIVPASAQHLGRIPTDSCLSANGGAGASAEAFSSPQNQHRKSNSLDAGDASRKASKPVSPPVRERYRCIVPYPPNSDYELELRVGDIIYVHKKRDDGWYKGTQQRTGRTGLFPASFVETF